MPETVHGSETPRSEQLWAAVRELLRAHDAEKINMLVECPRGSILIDAWDRAVNAYGDVFDPKNITLRRSSAMLDAVARVRIALKHEEAEHGAE